MKDKKIVLMWPSFAHFHVARLNAAASICKSHNIKIIGLEVSGFNKIHPWNAIKAEQMFERVVLFPDSEYWTINRKLIFNKTDQLLKEIDPDIIACNGWSLPEAIAALVWCRKNNKPSIIMSDVNQEDFKRCWIKEQFKKHIVALHDSGFVAAELQAKYLVNLGMNRHDISLGWDAIDNDFFHKNAINNTKKRNLTFITTARFAKEKNLINALLAYRNYCDEQGCKAWKWLLVGDGPLRKEIEKRINILNLSALITMPGFIQYEDLPKYYRIATAFWLPSVKDSFPLAVNEAMASNLPIIISHRCGNSSVFVLEGINGWTFDPYSIESMTRSLSRVHMYSIEELENMGHESNNIIEEWGPIRFATGLFKAIQIAEKNIIKRKKGLSVIDSLMLNLSLSSGRTS